jgi:hypothetical protein
MEERSIMVYMSLFIATGLGLIVGFGLGRMKSWLASHESKAKTMRVDSPVLRTRLRVKGMVK